MKKDFWIRSFFPGILLIVVAFFMGTHSHIIFALIGFLSFFVVGVTIIVEGWKKRQS